MRWLGRWGLVVALVVPASGGADEMPSLIALVETDLAALMEMSVVTPARRGQVASEAPASLHVVTQEMIQRRGYLTLEDVLSDLPGFDLATGQPAGEYPTHFLYRGIGDVGQTKVLIMVDGIVRNDVSNGWSRNVGYDFSLADVDKIEVIGGPGSALYGANAYAGLANVITHKPEAAAEGLSVAVHATIGAHGTRAPEAVISYRSRDGLAAQLAGRWFVTDGDDGDRPDPGSYFHNNFEPDTVLTTEYGDIVNERNADGSRKKLADGFGTDVDDTFLRGRVSKGGFELGFTLWDRDEGLGSEVMGYEYFANTDGIDYRAHHGGYGVYAAFRTDLREGISSYTRGYFRNDRVLPETGFTYTYKYQSVDNGVDPAVPDKQKSYHGEGFVAGLEQQLNWELRPNNSLVAGYQLEQEIKEFWGVSLNESQSTKSSIVESNYPTEERVVQPSFYSRNAAVYVQDEHRFAAGYTLTAGLRFDADDEYGTVFNPRAGLVRSVEQGLGFKLLYGQAFKAPSVFELFDEFRGNEALDPEKIATTEFELNYRQGNRAFLRAGLFTSHMTDLIKVAPDTTQGPVGSQGVYPNYYQNVGSTDVSGLSLTADVQLTGKAFGYANYSYTGGQDGDEVDNISQHKINAGVNVHAHRHLNVNLRANWRGRMKAPASNVYFHPKDAGLVADKYDYETAADADGYLEGHFLLHATLTGNDLGGYLKGLQPQLIVRNLLGTEYVQMGRQTGEGARPLGDLQPQIQNPEGFIPPYHPQPGREVLFVLRYQLGQ